MTLPTSARVVIIGGGISGCSVAYHLAKLGWQDILLLERKSLTSGTTWHAAGLIAQLRATENQTKLARYSADLYTKLESETGIATGMRQTGSITLALTDDRREEILRQASLARALGVEAHEITQETLLDLYPHLNTDGFRAAVHLPGDGQADPANIALALAKGARQRGVRIEEGVKVLDVLQERGQVTGIKWQSRGDIGSIDAEIVINCGGMWGRDLAAKSGVTLPLHACEHFYIVTESIPDLPRLPVLRVPDECAYYKEDAGKILLGAFEPKAKPWGMSGIPEDFEFDQLPEDFDHFEPILEQAVSRMPMLANTGIHTFFNGPESFTPDDRYYLGEAPNLRGYWVAAGYNSIGIASSGGAGMALAHWIEHGEPPFDLWDCDIRRAFGFQRSRKYLAARVSETLGLLYADHYPHRQFETARDIRRSPIHEALKSRDAVFGETAGWERANWFARPGQETDYRYSWHRQNWHENQRVEHLSIREGAGLYDMSSFGKLRIEGRDAARFLNRVCANEIDVPIGKIVYTQMLNRSGGIEADVTVTRLSETAFLMVTPAATVIRDMAWLHRHVSDNFAVITDVTAAEAVLCLMGPRSRDILPEIVPQDIGNGVQPFGTMQEIEIGMALARAHRVSYVGELGWELYVSADQAAHVFEALWQAGEPHDLKLCGLHAMDSLRMEKGFRHFGHDISSDDHVLEAGLGFAVCTKKPDFIGRDAVLRRKDNGLKSRLLQFRMDEPELMLHHNEPIWRDGEIVGLITSGAYGHTVGSSLGMGYVPARGETGEDLLQSKYHIEIAGEKHVATPSLQPFYDPRSQRMRT
ncbi:GcvT family protein [Algicella marina]|uniref:FAD-dependent oxidoreductase n=1 Tax=Algicella marina TaxID=2683284 RepID=A0A6P1T0C8_9RHOB|nr:FAD-dependent oxidoreductase [Algicella marina]QHQ34896.1 FAD-dependent oxidoreductase [Algicella marina]